jgi:hypothetical protein
MKTLKFLTLALATLALVFTSCTDPTDKVDATGISLDQVTATLSNAGPSVVELTATLTPADATSEITWGTSDPAIATVLGAGTNKAIVTATGAGVATITATANGFTAECEVTVTWEALYPEVAAPGAGNFTLLVRVPAGTCNGIAAVGTHEWDPATAAANFAMTPVAGWDGWYQITIPYDGSNEVKVCAIPQEGACSWNYQWGINSATEPSTTPLYPMEGYNVTFVGTIPDGASLTYEYGTQPKLIGIPDNAVIYMDVHAWAQEPCVAVQTEIVTFRCEVPAETPADAIINIAGSFEENGWSTSGREMTKVGNVYELTLTVPTNIQYKYTMTTAGESYWETADNRTLPAGNPDVVPSWGDYPPAKK